MGMKGFAAPCFLPVHGPLVPYIIPISTVHISVNFDHSYRQSMAHWSHISSQFQLFMFQLTLTILIGNMYICDFSLSKPKVPLAVDFSYLFFPLTEQGYSVVLPEKLQTGKWNVYR